MGVTLPNNALKDDAVKSIVRRFRKASSLVLLKSFILSLPVIFISGLVSISMMYIFLWFTVLLYANQRTVKKFWNELYALKKENNWWVGTPNVVSVDTEVSRLRDTFPVSRVWFVIPIIISVIPIVNTLIVGSDKIPWLSIFGVSSVMLLFFFYLIYCKARTITYSDNTDINVTLNRIYKREWTRCLVILATITSMFFTASAFLLTDMDNSYSTVMFIVIVVFTNIFVAVPIIYAYSKVRNARNKLLSLLNEEVCTDDDEYWVFGAMFYNNPNDDRIMVERRVGGFGFTFNIAKTGARIVCFLLFGILIGSMLWAIVALVPMDFGSVSLTINGQTATIQSPLDEYSFSTNGIVNVTTINTLPPMSKISGGNAPRFYSGSFFVTGYGISHINIHRNNPPYIVVELYDGWVIVNGRSINDTEAIYYELRNVLSD